jgi:hypothetical protein
MKLCGSSMKMSYLSLASFRTYNPEDGRGRKNPASKEKAMAELLETVSCFS